MNTSLHKGTNKRFIQHNGDWLCMVCVKRKTAYVYTIKNWADLAIEDDGAKTKDITRIAY